MNNKTKNKIAILYSGAKHFGGIETYLLRLFDLYPQNEIELCLFSLGDWELTRKLDQNKVTVTKFPASRFRIKTVFEIRDELLAGEFDLIVSQGTVANAYARAASIMSKVPNLVTVHSDPYFDYHNPFVRFIYVSVDLLTRFATKRYIAISHYLEKILSLSGVDKNRIVTVYNGVVFVPKKHKKASKKIVIGAVGRLHPVKGFHSLIEAVSLMNNYDIELRIAGTGEELESLQYLSRRLGIGDKVKFVGFAEDVAEFLSEVDIYCQPSLAEGFGLSVVESMLAEIPVVVTPSGSLNEIVGDGKTGLVTAGNEPTAIAAALARLIDDKPLQKRLSTAAATYAKKNFGVDEWIEHTIGVYKETAR